MQAKQPRCFPVVARFTLSFDLDLLGLLFKLNLASKHAAVAYFLAPHSLSRGRATCYLVWCSYW